MKPKIDEMPDEWVRQSLSRLPDGPPPGSSFNSDRLWAQLHTELEATPVRKRVGWRWRLAAACMAGFLLSWLFWQKPVNEQQSAATYQPESKQALRIQQPDLAKKMDVSAPIHVAKLPQKATAAPRPRQAITDSKPANVLPEPANAEPTATLSESIPVADVVAVTEKLPEIHKPNVAASKPKRRFPVVHENELRAEDEAAPKLYRTDHFVRLGMGRSDEPVVTPRTETPITLTTKKSQ